MFSVSEVSSLTHWPVPSNSPAEEIDGSGVLPEDGKFDGRRVALEDRHVQGAVVQYGKVVLEVALLKLLGGAERAEPLRLGR